MERTKARALLAIATSLFALIGAVQESLASAASDKPSKGGSTVVRCEHARCLPGPRVLTAPRQVILEASEYMKVPARSQLHSPHIGDQMNEMQLRSQIELLKHDLENTRVKALRCLLHDDAASADPQQVKSQQSEIDRLGKHSDSLSAKLIGKDRAISELTIQLVRCVRLLHARSSHCGQADSSGQLPDTHSELDAKLDAMHSKSEEGFVLHPHSSALCCRRQARL